MYVTRGHRPSPTASPRKTAFVHRSEIKFYTKTNPRFTVHAQVFSTQEAKKLVKLAKKIGFTDATVGESNSGDGSISTSIRRTKVSFLQTKDKRTHWVYARLERLVTSINALNWRFKLGPSVLRNDVSPDRMGAAILNSKLKNPLCRMLETLQVMKYTEKDKGFYDSHIDSGLFTSTAFRKLSVTVQLSNPKDYSGGQLELYTSKKPERMPRERGTAVIFPSYMLHRVTPVTKARATRWLPGFEGASRTIDDDDTCNLM
jgi:PKHD-type hydroxylase